MIPSRVAVVLSTYNGEKYLAEQLESIVGQDNVEVKLLIRDDGSRDSTVAIVRDFASRHANVRLTAGANKGVTESFLSALKEADSDCDFFAFADQDDVWDRRKLANAVERLTSVGDPSAPLLYCSQVELVDARLAHLRFGRMLREISFRNALFQNIVAGCTIVMNHRARDLIVRPSITRDILIHDWWCYLAISALGRILYDDRPTIKYRQHGNNVVGSQTTLMGRIVGRYERTLHGLHGRFPSEQNELFLKLYGEELSEEQRRFAEWTLAAKRSLRKRLTLASSRQIRMQTAVEDLCVRLGILLNRF